MSFNNALSGVNAAQKDLNVTANNIANVNTTGFKESRAEFADVYANSIFVNAKTQVGNGVATGAVAQQFHQGALQFTNNALDLSIQGNGFFVTSDVGDLQQCDDIEGCHGGTCQIRQLARIDPGRRYLLAPVSAVWRCAARYPQLGHLG